MWNVTPTTANRVSLTILRQYKTLKKKFDEHKGYLAEVYMIQMLWNAQGQGLPGHFFHSPIDIQMPNRFFFIDQRRRTASGVEMETDIYAGAADEVWIGESKWWSKPLGTRVVETLLTHADLAREREGEGLNILRLWLFAHSGVTAAAQKMMIAHGVLWSTREDLDGLLRHVKVRTLPDV